MTFTPDENLQKIAEAYAQDACDLALRRFEVTLDWTDASIAEVEWIISGLHEQAAAEKVPDDRLLTYAKVFGSYLGEVFRRNHGATWGVIDREGEQIPGLLAERVDLKFWPWIRARNRIVDGPEDDLSAYYDALLEALEGKAPTG